MNIVVGLVIIALALINIAAHFYLFRFFNRMNDSINKVHARIDSLFSMDLPTENTATKEDPNLVDISDNPSIPENVKLEVEGGQTQVPPDFSEAK